MDLILNILFSKKILIFRVLFKQLIHFSTYFILKINPFYERRKELKKLKKTKYLFIRVIVEFQEKIDTFYSKNLF